MRVLLVVDSYLPEPKAAGPLMHSLARELRRRGHEVIVLTCSDKLSTRYTDAIEDGIRVIRVASPKLKGVNLVRRALSELLLSRIVWRRAKSAIAPLSADLIAFYSPTIFWGPLVARLKNLWGCRTVLILRDIFPQWAVDAGQMRHGPHLLLFQHYADLQYRIADRIGVQSPNNRAYFQDSPEYLDKIGVLFNWTAETRTADIEDPRPALGIAPDTPIFLYGGNLGAAQDPDLLLQAARTLQTESRAFFLIVGEGSAAAEITRAIQREKLSNIAFWKSVSQERFLAIARSCDAGVIALNRNLSTHNFPGKLLTYISAGLPVVASVNPGNDLQTVLEDARAGLCNCAHAPEAFIANAQRMAADPELRAMLAANLLSNLSATFSVERVANFLLD